MTVPVGLFGLAQSTASTSGCRWNTSPRRSEDSDSATRVSPRLRSTAGMQSITGWITPTVRSRRDSAAAAMSIATVEEYRLRIRPVPTGAVS